MSICSAVFVMVRTSYILKWDEEHDLFVLDQHAELEFYSASSLKQQSASRHVTSLEG